jgi:transcriptional regulator with XRE-family HTH domain
MIPEWSLGDRLSKSRRAAGLSSTDLQEYLGVTRNTISNYERDRIVPRLSVLRLWAMRCGVPLEWLDPSTKWYSPTAALRVAS